MSYQQLAKNSKSINGGLTTDKMPKCAAVAFWWFIVLGTVNLISGLFFAPYASQPWTVYADQASMALGLLFCAFAIAMRNARAVLLAVIALTIILLMHSLAATLAIVPIAFLLFPQCIRWLAFRGQFPIVTLVVAVLLILFNGLMYFMPSVSEINISNENPLRIVSPGFCAIYYVNELNQHEYYYWQHGCQMGKYLVQYNQNGDCIFVRLDIFSGGVKTETEYQSFFLKPMKELCDQRFGDVSWSDAATDEGLTVLSGSCSDDRWSSNSFDRERNKVLIEIFPQEDPYVYGSLLVYKPQLMRESRPPTDKRKQERHEKESAYGKGIPDSYGANKNLFYATPYKASPLGLGIPDSYGTNRNVYANPYKHM